MRRTLAWLPLTMAVLLAAVYVVVTPHTADLAAQTAREEVFRRSGYVPFWAGWYAGVTTTSYSLLSPPLLAWLGAGWLGALTVAATPLVARPLLQGARRPLAGETALVVSAFFDVVSGRTTFALGALIGMAALVGVQRRRGAASALLGVLTTAASPVAGVLLLVVSAAVAAVDRSRRSAATASGVGAVGVLAVLAVLARGDGGGYQPFSVTSLVVAGLTGLVALCCPGDRRVRAAATLSTLALVAAFLVHSPVGANVTRLPILFAAAAVLATARLRALLLPAVAAAAILPVAQLHNDLASAAAGPGSHSFVAGLVGRLDRDPLTVDHRVEVVDTATHWPSTYLLPYVSLARGWERQVDESRNPLFYGRAPLTAASYRRFLDSHAVGLVAVPRGVRLDYGSTAEAALVATRLPYLKQVWQDADWTLYDVSRPTPLVAAPGRVVRQVDTGIVIDAPRAGTYRIRLRWSPYLVVSGGQVRRTADDQVAVTLRGSGRHVLHGTWRLP